MPDYTIVLDASSAVRIEPPGAALEIANVQTRFGPVRVRWYTFHSEEGFEVPIPRELWVEITGTAPSLAEASGEFTDAGRVLTPYLAFVANAAIDDPEFLLGYDSGDASTGRPFRQALRASSTGWFRPSRQLDLPIAGPTVAGIFGHREHDRLHRGVVNYNEALKAWRPGTELRAVLHLWFAVEALTKAALRNELARSGFTQEELLDAWQIDLRALDGEVRKRLIFHGDAAAYSEVRAVSDGAEHSFERFADLHPRAAAVRDQAAAHLRRAIADSAELPSNLIDELFADKWKSPHESFAHPRIIRGTLIGGEAGNLAADGYPHPWIDWNSGFKSVAKNADGSYVVTPEETTSFRLAEGVSMGDLVFELWGPRLDAPRLNRADLEPSESQVDDPGGPPIDAPDTEAN